VAVLARALAAAARSTRRPLASRDNTAFVVPAQRCSTRVREKRRTLPMPSPLLSAARAPAVFFDEFPHRVDLDRLPGNDPFQLRVLGFELFESREVARFHPAVLIAPEPNRIGMNAVLARQFRRRRSGIELLEDPYDLRFGEAAFLHVNLLGPRPGIHSFNLSRFATSGQTDLTFAGDAVSAALEGGGISIACGPFGVAVVMAAAYASTVGNSYSRIAEILEELKPLNDYYAAEKI
jgi:hypothetical protein